jgi:hypothetical protein
MGWFNRKPKEETPPVVISPPPTSRVEVELHKGASEDAAKKANLVNEHIKDLLVENGFTIKIALAAGAQISHKKQGGKN